MIATDEKAGKLSDPKYDLIGEDSYRITIPLDQLAYRAYRIPASLYISEIYIFPLAMVGQS